MTHLGFDMNIKQHKYIYANRFINYQLSTINHKCEAKRNYYASGLGRFTGKDPLEKVLSNLKILNKYIYVDNNSLISIDPSGLRRLSQPGIGKVVNKSKFDIKGFWSEEGWHGEMTQTIFKAGESVGGFFKPDADFVCATEEVPINGNTSGSYKVEWNTSKIENNKNAKGVTISGYEGYYNDGGEKDPCSRWKD